MSNDESDGVASYQGYEYQILATVWLGLELMIGRQDCTSIVVEPGSGEDVAANFQVSPETAVLNVTLEVQQQQPIEVQIKLRRTDQWTPARFQEVVRGSGGSASAGSPGARRRPIEQLLASPAARFVLLTNAQVNADLGPFLIDQLGVNSSANAIPGKARAGESE